MCTNQVGELYEPGNWQTVDVWAWFPISTLCFVLLVYPVHMPHFTLHVRVMLVIAWSIGIQLTNLYLVACMQLDKGLGFLMRKGSYIMEPRFIVE